MRASTLRFWQAQPGSDYSNSSLEADLDEDLEDLEEHATKFNTVRACGTRAARLHTSTVTPARWRPGGGCDSWLHLARAIDHETHNCYHCAQDILKKAGGRRGLKGDPSWTTIITVNKEPDVSIGSWKDSPPEMLEMVSDLACDGGGFTSAGTFFASNAERRRRAANGSRPDALIRASID